MKSALGISCLLLALAVASGDPTQEALDDMMTDLPGIDFSTVEFNQYSGYLDAGDTVMLHYWFTESQNDSANDPVILWMNGGPGCSSLDGLLTELGPFHIMDDSQTLYVNEYSWNTFANVVFLESPACVGFSYAKDGDCLQTASDNDTALANYKALLEFFKRFPDYASNEFYVTGESYAGIYAPTLVLQIILNDNQINLKGFAIGNPLSDYSMNDDSLLFFANYHGLYDQDLWNNITQECCDGPITKDTCEFSESANLSPCSLFVTEGISRAIGILSNMDPYNLYNPCPQFEDSNLMVQTVLRHRAERLGIPLDQLLPRKVPYDGAEISDCPTDEMTTAYLNQDSVRTALHIPDGVQDWIVCNNKLNVQWDRTYESMAETHQQIQNAGIRGMIYNGDVDMMCNFLGDQWFVESLGYEMTAERRPWYYGGLLGGFVKKFELMDLVTVRGSGHMVPKDKPKESLHMIRSFIENTDY